MRVWVTAFLMLGLALAASCAYWWHRRNSSITWAKVNTLIVTQFPQVHQLSVPQLRAWLADARRPPPVLLDVRAKIEYQVSHLQHAQWINAAQPVAQALAGVSKEQPIVTYCSVGYRSSAYAQRLMKDGFKHVDVLHGSIFAWANADLPVYRAGKIVHHVHPYDRHWGQLLRRSLWAFHPPTKKPWSGNSGVYNSRQLPPQCGG